MHNKFQIPPPELNTTPYLALICESLQKLVCFLRRHVRSVDESGTPTKRPECFCLDSKASETTKIWVELFLQYHFFNYTLRMSLMISKESQMLRTIILLWRYHWKYNDAENAAYNYVVYF